MSVTTASARQPGRPRTLRLVALSVTTAALCAAGVGIAAATSAESPQAVTAAPGPDPVGPPEQTPAAVEAPAPEAEAGQSPAAAADEWSAMPDGYTLEQYEAFWGAGYSAADVLALGELWSTDDTETKARAGQLVLDGAELPLQPTAVDPAVEEALSTQVEAFFAAGYTVEDAVVLSDVWDSELVETKATAGQHLLEGRTLPVAPSSTPEAAAQPAPVTRTGS